MKLIYKHLHISAVALKLFSLMVTVDHTGPDAGEKPVMEGCAEAATVRVSIPKRRQKRIMWQTR